MSWQNLIHQIISEPDGTRLVVLARWRGPGCAVVVDITGRWRAAAGSRLDVAATCGTRHRRTSWPLPATSHPTPEDIRRERDAALRWAEALTGPADGTR
jgi:hypothetical protein